VEALPYSEVEPYEGIVNTLARRYSGRRHGIEFDDAYQEGLLCVVVSLRDGAMPPPGEEAEAKIERWLRAEVRKVNRQIKGDVHVPFIFGGTRQNPTVQLDIRDALAALPPELLTVVLLRHYHGYEVNEIAALLGVSISTVYRRETDARLKLRRKLA
jgi:DNA-directed RNA polymerase specialized sigma24 family protein